MGKSPNAIIIERNPILLRKFERFFRCAGLRPIAVDEPEQAGEYLADCRLIAADVFDGEVVQELMTRNESMEVLCWTAEPMERALRMACGNPRISNILGRTNFEALPREWELMMVLRRLIERDQEGPKLGWFMNWGFTGFQREIDSSTTRDKVVRRVERFLIKMGCRTKVADAYSLVAHELLMNAMYDAPLNTDGKPKYAQNRKAELDLLEHERPLFKLASDGSKLAIQVADSFGGLKRETVFDGLARGLRDGGMNTDNGGAGLGMTMILNGTSSLFIDVIEGVKTEVTGLFELETTNRDFRTMPKSLHFFSC